MVRQKHAIQPGQESQIKKQALGPQQHQGRTRSPHRLPHAPAVGGGGQNKNKKQKERVSDAHHKNGDQRRPHDIGAVHQQAERFGRFQPAPQQHNDQKTLGNVEGQQSGNPYRETNLSGIDQDGDQGGPGQENPSRGQPALNAAYFARVGRGSKPPERSSPKQWEQWRQPLYGRLPRILVNLHGKSKRNLTALDSPPERLSPAGRPRGCASAVRRRRRCRVRGGGGQRRALGRRSECSGNARPALPPGSGKRCPGRD